MKRGKEKTKRAILLFLVMVLNRVVTAQHDYGLARSESGRWLYGKGNAPCKEEWPTLSVAKENLINTKDEWDAFVKKNPFFVLSAADSKCARCCQAEPILLDLQIVLEGKENFAYPHKNVK